MPDRSRGRRVLAVGLLVMSSMAHGYDSDVHQRLTFHAAKLLNRCLEGSAVAPLTPLQVRFIATSNMGLANTNFLMRFFRWSYYDPDADDGRRFLWLVNTRFVDHFEELAAELRQADSPSARYQALGRIVSYVQLVSSPSRALPVYAARFWRWSFGDRFDGYAVDGRALEAAVEAHACRFLEPAPVDYRSVLRTAAADTLAAVRAPIGPLPTTWEAFWVPPDEPGEFGEYGSAGNSFGRKVTFDCTAERAERCVLLEGDPLYDTFALDRQLAAVRATARAMYRMQLDSAAPPAGPRTAAPSTPGLLTDAPGGR